ncbi:LAFE_0D10528g1_1 [Lachancea fermentati]|uniref:Glutamate--tRNA ligase, mitochondrial n=1 Tax=Lachancea fermentati TaxID=4955 RepID=A0A1G4MBX2_LACFM|nr:LAFE_0D10528g1_1 [Lachancea fermentati]
MNLLARRRLLSTLKARKPSLVSKKSLISQKPVRDVHPELPARTRFAPSPTGFLHLGSLRTALYNYLLAKNTGGKFLLRLEDTDQKRLVPGAEQAIYDSLKWCGIEYDEGPGVCDHKYGPYRQSDRTDIYRSYIEKLLQDGHAYRCFCSKERLDNLRDSAQKLKPPTTVSYDRHCEGLSEGEIEKRLQQGIPYTIRFKSPSKYPVFDDLLHGVLDMQPQVNSSDVRYDDPILLKSDGLPTYHFANVVDDHLMKITHVIRGEEWLPSTPKHIALYKAFGWEHPQYVHIPLLTSSSDKKLSKRKGDADVLNLRAKGVLPEALVNFSVLFGWSPPRDLASMNHECFSLKELTGLFNLNHLTKGNAKVDEKKLWYFNKHYISQRLENETQFQVISREASELVQMKYPNITLEYVQKVLRIVGKSLETINEFPDKFYYFFEEPKYHDSDFVSNFKDSHDINEVKLILKQIRGKISDNNINTLVNSAVQSSGLSKRAVFETIRFALAGSVPGVKLPVLAQLLGDAESNRRIEKALQEL